MSAVKSVGNTTYVKLSNTKYRLKVDHFWERRKGQCTLSIKAVDDADNPLTPAMSNAAFLRKMLFVFGEV
jgi:hypothetical protein